MIKPILIIALASLAPFVKASHYIPLSSKYSINGGTLYKSKKSKKTSFLSWLLPKKEIPKLNNITKPYVQMERKKERESKEYYFVEAQIYGLSKEKIKEYTPLFYLNISPLYINTRCDRVNILYQDECYRNLAELHKRRKFAYLLLEKTKRYYYYALKIKKEKKVTNRFIFLMVRKKDNETRMQSQEIELRR